MTSTIRNLVEADREAWRPLWHRYLAYNGMQPGDAPVATWDRLMDAAEPMHAIGVVVDDALAGFAHFVFHRHSWWEDDLCLLMDVFTSEVARRQGAGTALVEAVFERAREAGSRCVWGIAMTGNLPARAIYDRITEQLDQTVYRKLLGP